MTRGVRRHGPHITWVVLKKKKNHYYYYTNGASNSSPSRILIDRAQAHTTLRANFNSYQSCFYRAEQYVQPSPKTIKRRYELMFIPHYSFRYNHHTLRVHFVSKVHSISHYHIRRNLWFLLIPGEDVIDICICLVPRPIAVVPSLCKLTYSYLTHNHIYLLG